MIGCGTIAYWQHLRNLKRLGGVRIAAVADPDPLALARAAKLIEVPCHAGAETLLARDDVDAVVIASPAGLHSTHVEAACASGRHVYVEKPLAHDAGSLARVEACAGKASTVFAVGYNYRFHPALRRLRDELVAGSIGTVRAIFSHFTETADPDTWPGWRRERAQGGGVLLDLASHHFDLWRWLLADELGGLDAEMRAPDSSQNSACVRGTSRGGVDLAGYFAHGGGRSHALTVLGAAGTLQVDVHAGRLWIERPRRRGYGTCTRAVKAGARDLTWRVRKRMQPSFDPSHALALGAFIDAIAGSAQRDGDLAGLEDGAAALRAVLGIEGRRGAGTAPGTS